MNDKEFLRKLEERINEDKKINDEYEQKWGEILEAYYEGELPPESDVASLSSMVALYEPAKLVLPTISSAVDVAHSALINILTQTDPIFLVRNPQKELSDLAKEIEDHLNLWYRRLNARISFSPIVTEFLLHGWAVAKLVRDIWTDIPYLELIPRKDFVAPKTKWSPGFANKIEYVAHRFYLSKWELLIRKDKYENIDELVKKLHRDSELAEIWEIYQYDENMNDFRYTVSFEHNLILKKEEYKYPRGFFVFPYIPRRHDWRGIGMGQQLKALQEERDALHRLNINSIKLYINKIVQVRENAGVDLNDIKAGAKIYVRDLDNTIRVTDLVRDLHPIQLTAEENSWRYAQMRSMITDYRLGMESRGIERPTARGVMMLLSEANKISNYVVDNLKDVLKEIGYTLLVWSYFDNIIPLLSEKEKRSVEQIKDLNVIKDILGIEIGINSAVLNREVQRQNVFIAMQILAQYLQQVMPLIAQYPQVPEPIKGIFEKIIGISDNLFKRAIYTLDIDIESPEFLNIIKSFKEAQSAGGQNPQMPGDIQRAFAELYRQLYERANQGEVLGGGPEATE